MLAVGRADGDNFKHNVRFFISGTVNGSFQSFFVLNVFLVEFGDKQRLAAHLAGVHFKTAAAGSGGSDQRNVVYAVTADLDGAVQVNNVISCRLNILLADA